ncbi:MAG: formate dehydrogenase accessory sulfurtransferase FdhD [Planctomycetota bacterium]
MNDADAPSPNNPITGSTSPGVPASESLDRGSRQVMITRYSRANQDTAAGVCNITSRRDDVTIEEPLEIRIVTHSNDNQSSKDQHSDDQSRLERSISVTMRTPGHDVELALGFLVGEGIIQNPEDVHRVRSFSHDIVRVEMAPGHQFDLGSLQRHFFTSSSCGVCGKTSIDALHRILPVGQSNSQPRISDELIYSLGERLRDSQSVFDRTGGLHASGLFTVDGKMIAIREDVGRHNALDKLIGATWFSTPEYLSDAVLCLSGRVSFELLQKSAMVGIPIIVAVGAPSTLAIELAAQAGITLVGFVRSDRFNVYTGPERINTDR